MQLYKTENLLNLSSQKDLPQGLLQGLYIRFSGDAAAGVTIATSDLGQVRVNYRGQDIINVPVSFISLFNNLHWGVAEFASAVGAAFSASIYVPFHMPWENTNGLLNLAEDKGFFELRFPLLTAAKIDSGTVEVYYIKARSVASYIPLLIQQNIQAGGAGNVNDKILNYNVSSLYLEENAHLTGQVMVFKDGQVTINSTQAVLKSKSNFDNRVEAAIALIQVNLNPTNLVAASLGEIIEVQAVVDAATTLAVYYLSVLFQGDRSSGQAVVSTMPQGGNRAVAGQGGIPKTASAAYLADLNAGQ